MVRRSSPRSSNQRPRWVLVVVLLLAGGSLAALGALRASHLHRSSSAELSRERREAPAETDAAAGALRQALQALAERHPERDLGPAARQVLTLAAPGASGSAEAAFAALERGLLEELTGLGPDDALWGEAGRYGSFSPAGFKELQDRLVYPDCEPIRSAPSLTGHEAADRRVASLAEGRGYRLRWRVDETALAGSLHRDAQAAWRSLQAAAAEEGVSLALVSGYRSVERQRTIFLSHLRSAGEQALGRPYRPEVMAAGAADAAILAILAYSSIPGYSKHHSGCALDLSDPSSGLDYTEFGRTTAYAWLSRHNYLNAKRFGFVPSYPPAAPAQGPEPEPWEFVWVGEAPLRALAPAGTER